MTRQLFAWSRPAACGLTLLLVAVFAWQFGRGPVAQLAAEYRESQHWQQVLAKAEARAADLDLACSRSLPRATVKIGLARDMIAGRIGAQEAARQYADLPGRPANFLPQLRVSEQGSTDHERLCRHLIDYACSLIDSESASEAVRCRLIADLEESLKHDAQPGSTPPAAQ